MGAVEWWARVQQVQGCGRTGQLCARGGRCPGREQRGHIHIGVGSKDQEGCSERLTSQEPYWMDPGSGVGREAFQEGGGRAGEELSPGFPKAVRRRRGEVGLDARGQATEEPRS